MSDVRCWSEQWPSLAQVQFSVLRLTYRDAVYPPAIYHQLILQTLHSQDFFFLSPSLVPSLPLFLVEMLIPHSASSTRSSTCTGISHTDPRAGSVGPVQISPLPFLPLHRGFSPGGENCGEQRGRLV